MIQYESPLAIKIRKQIVQALNDFQMLSHGDKIMVCVSGGKDSSVLLALLTEIQRRSEREFELEAVILDQKQPGFDSTAFETWVRDEVGVPLTVLERDTYSVVKEKVPEGNTYCSLCSRFRRAILYDHAFERGFHKMALGHHRDDVATTFLLNTFYVGTLASMPPKLLSDDGRNLIIRPLYYVDERDIAALAEEWQIPIIPCNLCGSQDGLKRARMKKLLRDLEQEIPQIVTSLQTAMKRVQPSHLADQHLYNFHSLEEKRQPRIVTVHHESERVLRD